MTETGEMPETILREVLADRRYNFSYGSPGVRIGQAQAALDELLSEFQGLLDELNDTRGRLKAVEETDTGVLIEAARKALTKTVKLENGFSQAAREALEMIESRWAT